MDMAGPAERIAAEFAVPHPVRRASTPNDAHGMSQAPFDMRGASLDSPWTASGGERDHEAAPGCMVGDRDLTAVSLDDALDDGQSEAGPAPDG